MPNSNRIAPLFLLLFRPHCLIAYDFVPMSLQGSFVSNSPRWWLVHLSTVSPQTNPHSAALNQGKADHSINSESSPYLRAQARLDLLARGTRLSSPMPAQQILSTTAYVTPSYALLSPLRVDTKRAQSPRSYPLHCPISCASEPPTPRMPQQRPVQPVTEHKPGTDFHGVPNPPNGSPLRLSDLRERLIRQEETIIFSLIERAQFKRNDIIYTPNAFELPVSSQNSESPACDGTFSQYMLYELEKVYASVRRYTSPDEHPFAPPSQLPAPLLPSLSYPKTLVDNDINVNDMIEKVYRNSIIPSICESGDDQNYGSSAVCDTACLQALSKRVHYGKFIAEAKCQSDETLYAKLAANNEQHLIWNELSDFTVEHHLLQRVEKKARNYGRDITVDAIRDVYKVQPSVISQLYKDFIIPLTKEVEVEYILHRYKTVH